MLSYINYWDFDKFSSGNLEKYYYGRWEYISEMISLIKKLDVKTVLELGPGKNTIVKNCDVMVKPKEDKWGRPMNKVNKEIVFDANEFPWPIEDKAYDLFIAAHVFEYLSNKQTKAFREVMRISKMAVITFPYLWNCSSGSSYYPESHMIDKELISDWTLGVEPDKIITVRRTAIDVSRGRRLIYFWNFDEDKGRKDDNIGY